MPGPTRTPNHRQRVNFVKLVRMHPKTLQRAPYVLLGPQTTIQIRPHHVRRVSQVRMRQLVLRHVHRVQQGFQTTIQIRPHRVRRVVLEHIPTNKEVPYAKHVPWEHMRRRILSHVRCVSPAL